MWRVALAVLGWRALRPVLHELGNAAEELVDAGLELGFGLAQAALDLAREVV